MKKVRLTAKELDAIDSMVEYWYSAGEEFNTQTHGKFKEKDMEILINKLGHRQKEWSKFKKVV